MSYPTGNDTRLNDPVSGGGLDTQHYTAMVVFASMIFLWGIRKGFRGMIPGR